MSLAPIYIPTKGRATQSQTAKLLMAENIDFTLIVEPQDLYSYSQRFGSERCVAMDRNDAGIAYARNFTKRHSISKGETYHWQIDDDFRRFMIRSEGKNKPAPAREVLSKAEKYTLRFSNVAQANITHVTFAWTKKEPVQINRQCYGCVLFNNAVPIEWRDGVIEDIDYSLQVLFRGAHTKNSDSEPRWCTISFNHLLFDTPASGSMPGGNTEISHANGGRAKRSIETQKLWPSVLSLKHEYGSIRLAPTRIWSKFPQRLVPIS